MTYDPETEEQWAATWPGPWWLHVAITVWMVVLVARFTLGAFRAGSAGGAVVQAGLAVFCGLGILAFGRLALAKWRVRHG